jgi:hypothetical protein
MINKIRKVHRHFFLIFGVIPILALMGGCATLQGKPSEAKKSKPEASKVEAPLIERRFPEFIAVIVQEGDTLSSFAAKYLNDPSMDWFIAEYNEVDILTPGRTLIIP